MVTKSSALWPQAHGKPSGLFHVELLSKRHKVKGGAHCPEWELPSKPFRSGGCQASRGWWKRLIIVVLKGPESQPREVAADESKKTLLPLQHEMRGSRKIQALDPGWDGCPATKQLLAPQQLRARLPPAPSGRLRKKSKCRPPRMRPSVSRACIHGTIY